MKYRIVLAPSAVDDLRRLRAFVRAEVKDGLNRYLAFNPAVARGSRIKRLRGVSRPQFRLRLGDVRVFYDVVGDTVEVLGIVSKESAEEWLSRGGEQDEESGSN